MSWLLAFVGFAALIILHEAGHFVAAKAVGMRVERFFLFFPPKVWSFKRGETEYGIGAIPLGGFVKITGMNPEEEVELDDPQPGTGEGVEPETVPAPEYPRSYFSQPVWKRIVVIGAGPAVNIVIAFVILFVLAFDLGQSTNRGRHGGRRLSPPRRSCSPATSSSPSTASDAATLEAAARADRDATSAPASRPTAAAPRRPSELTIVRDGQRTEVEAKPVYDAAAGRPLARLRLRRRARSTSVPAAPRTGRSTRCGWSPPRPSRSSPGSSTPSSASRSPASSAATRSPGRRSSSAPARRSSLLALISLSLAVINLFPFLPLDGGHIFWSLVEKVRGRPVSFADHGARRGASASCSC